MSAVALQVPLLVSYRPKVGYRVSCLFLPTLHASAARYEKALSRLRQAIVHRFHQTRPDRSLMDDLLWLSFAPPMRFERVPLGFDAGQRWVEGLFAMVFFSIGERHYACCPMLDSLIIDLGPDGLTKTERTERLVARLQADFRERRKNEGDDFVPAHHMAAPTDELGELDVSFQLWPQRFPFEDVDDWRSRLHQGPVDGAVEVRRVASNLNDLYPDDLAPALECDALVDELRQSIYRGDPSALVLVGPRGAGKTALIQGAIHRYLASEVGRDPTKLPKVWHLDPLRVVSGMSVVGAWQRRMEAVLQHLRSRRDHLYCDNLVALLSVGKSAQNHLTLADVLRPHLEARALTVVGEATPQAWQVLQQRDRRLADLFRVVRIEPPAPATARRIITWRRAALEQRHECLIGPDAVAELLKMDARFAGDEVLPGSALRVLERLASRHAKQSIGRAEVLAAFTASHRFREAIFSRHQGLDLSELSTQVARRLIGQPAVRSCLIDVVALVKSGLAAPGKPLSSLLFIGPTGVGKSEAAKLLAELLFDEPQGLLRFDMNEYIDADAVDRLIGNAQRPDGQLTSAVRQRRAAVVLLDEIEKAHPAVHDLLLQVLGEGRLTDALGRTTDFSQCVIVLTSNLGASAAARTTGFTPGAADARHTYREAVERFFRPEFFNRIDQVVSFEPLSATDMAAIAHLQLDRVLAREGFTRRMTFLNLTPQALHHLAQLGRDESLGARALKRGIERALTAPIARRLASSPSGQAMRLDVHLSSEQTLLSEATFLTQAPPRPVAWPAHSDRPADYLALQAWTEDLHVQLWAALDQAPERDHELALRSIQVPLDGLREVLSRRCWDLSERRGPHTLVTPRPSRTLKGKQQYWSHARQTLLNEMTLHDDLSEFLDHVHDSAEPVRHIDGETARWHLELSVLARRFEALQAHGIDRIQIRLRPLQEHLEAPCSVAAWADYETLLLSVLDAQALPGDTPQVRGFEGAGLRDLLQGECGIHLWFVGPQARPVPMCVQVEPWGAPAGPLPTEIIRWRREPAQSGAEGNLTDLRSTLVRRLRGPIERDDWRTLLYSGEHGALEPVNTTGAGS